MAKDRREYYSIAYKNRTPEQKAEIKRRQRELYRLRQDAITQAKLEQTAAFEAEARKLVTSETKDKMRNKRKYERKDPNYDMPEWRVVLIDTFGRFHYTVYARTKEEAVKKAIRKCGVNPDDICDYRADNLEDTRDASKQKELKAREAGSIEHGDASGNVVDIRACAVRMQHGCGCSNGQAEIVDRVDQAIEWRVQC